MTKYINKNNYVIYNNDIKYSESLDNVDKEALYDNKLKDNIDNNITNKLEYRIQLCEKENYDHIDLSYLDNKLIKNFFSSTFYLKKSSKIKHLFMSNCNIYNIPNISKMEKLETLDISYNNIDELDTNLPNSLTELIINNNRIKSLDINLNNLIRLNCSNNKLRKVPYLSNIQKLDISNNDVYTMDDEYKQLLELDCNNTKIIHTYSLIILYLMFSHTVPTLNMHNFLVFLGLPKGVRGAYGLL